MLRRPEGATIAQLMDATSWMPHSVRGMISGALKRKLGLIVESSVEPDRGRVYHIDTPVTSPPADLPVDGASRKKRRVARRREQTAGRPGAAG